MKIKILSLLLLLPVFSACEFGSKSSSGEINRNIPPFLNTLTEQDIELYARVQNANPQSADPAVLAQMLNGLVLANGSLPPTSGEKYQIGDIRSFWIHNNDTFEFIEIQAELMAISVHAYMWQDIMSVAANAEGNPASADEWNTAALTFDSTYVAVQAVFGGEDSPGIDGDERVYVIHSDSLGNVGGYFGEADQLPQSIESHSNEGQYFYISNTGAGVLGGDYYNETLAHEYQHMIHNYIDPNEEGWMNEGLSMLAQQIAGMRGDVQLPGYLINLDQSLWYWGGGSADYGHSYLFFDYLYEQFGEEIIINLSADSENGLLSIENTLKDMGISQMVDELYGDFIIATFLNDLSISDGRYGFVNPTVGDVLPTQKFETLPILYEANVNQYGGADVLEIMGSSKATLTFNGARGALLIPTAAHSGVNMWWSNRADASISTLTRQIDLRDTDTAVLTYWTWYDIEKDWDYAYVMVSQDDGNTWTILPSTSSLETNPNDNNYGFGLSGASGGNFAPVWVQETVNLDNYAGERVLLRYAVINDLVVNEEGLAIDDIEISAIGWKDDVEDGEQDWIAEGFVRSHNRVPQIWTVRVVEFRRDGEIEIYDLEIIDGIASHSIDFEEIEMLLVFVIAQTRFTTMAAPYYIIVE